MKPIHSFLFLTAVLAGISIVMLLFPEDGVSINGETKITFVSFEDIFSNKKVEYADISAIIASADTVSFADTAFHDDEIDSIIVEIVGNDTIIDTVRANASMLRKSILPIEYGDNGDPTCLFKFFAALENADKNVVRVIHYGDSQIEGDRITGIIRNRLQKTFGGFGAGLISAYDPNTFVSVLRLDHSGSWERHTRYGLKDTLVDHARWGLMASFCRFSPILKDETDSSTYFGSIILHKKSAYRKSLRSFENLRIFCGNASEPADYAIFCGDSLYKKGIIDSSKLYHTIKWQPDTLCEEVRMVFKGKYSPDFYGISFEPNKGIVVDNIPLRGSSGLEFTRISQGQLMQQYKQLNAKLIILEFGVNVVPNVLEDYSFYEKRFYKQLMRLKKLAPDASILVIGISDMSRKAGNYYESYPNVVLIREAQRNAVFKAGCAYWDMYTAMGGENSMPSWVFAEPALANPDFTHFTPRGAKIIGEMFMNALLDEYKNFQSDGDGGFDDSETLDTTFKLTGTLPPDSLNAVPSL